MFVLIVLMPIYVVISSFATTHHCHNETGRCYWLGTGSKTWVNARASCQNDGGDLAVMETEELWDFVYSANIRYFPWKNSGQHCVILYLKKLQKCTFSLDSLVI